MANPSICVILSVRNEAPYLAKLLPHLAAQNIEVALIDHESQDAMPEILARHREDPLILVEKLPYLGFFSLRQQLECKRAIIERLQQDWLVHQDADEILEHREPGKTLREVIEETQELGYNAVNFEEFTFIPEPRMNYEGQDYLQQMRRYYFFQVQKNRLNRAWKRTANLENVSGAGHHLRGEQLRLAPYTHVLRHYIGLSQEHLWNKYLNRRFDPEELAIGWHYNRKDLTKEQLRLPKNSPHLQYLSPNSQNCLCRHNAVSTHYWHWHDQANAEKSS